MELVAPHFGKKHHVTMDTWFTSPKLLQDLRNRGTYATSTVVVKRKGLPQSFKTTRLPKGGCTGEVTTRPFDYPLFRQKTCYFSNNKRQWSVGIPKKRKQRQCH